MLAAAALVVPVLLAASASGLPSPKSRWIEVKTPSFTLVSSASEAKTKEVGLELERLRAALSLLKPGMKVSSPIPTTVYVFASAREMEPYTGRYNGKPRAIQGFFTSGREASFLALRAGWGEDPRRLVYHEYMHHYLGNNFRRLPAWFNEGVAEYYSTFQATETTAKIGRIVGSHVDLLRQETLLPIEALMAVDSSSPDYNERSRRSLFYAQSWALVHYLLNPESKRNIQLGRYLTLIQDGTESGEAFREAFSASPEKLLAELSEYLRGSRFLYRVIDLRSMNLQVPWAITVAPLRHEDVLARLGDLVARAPDPVTDAETHYRAALAIQPEHVPSLVGLGRLRFRSDRIAEARPFFERAVALGTADPLAHYFHGLCLFATLDRKGASSQGADPESRQALDAVRQAFRRSIELAPDFAEPRAQLARTYIVDEDSRLAEGIALLEEAVRRLPTRDDLARDLEFLRRRQRNAEAAAAAAAAAPPRAVATMGPDEAPEKTVADIEARLKRAKTSLERSIVEEQLKAARDVTDYNAAVALVSQRKLREAEAAFRKVAASAGDPDLAKAARVEADRLARTLAAGSTR